MSLNRYRIEVYTATNAARIGTLSDVIDIRFTRGISEPDSIRLTISTASEQLTLLTHGVYVRVYDEASDDLLAEGFVSGKMPRGIGQVEYDIDGSLTKLAQSLYPPEYLIDGDLAANASRLVQSYDWRRITAKATAATGNLGDEIVTFDGSGSGNDLASKTNITSEETVVPGEDFDSAGAIFLTGAGPDGMNAPYAASGTYESPFLDFRTTPTTWDRLRWIGEWTNRPSGSPRNEVTWQFSSFEALTDARVFPVAAAEPVDPEGLGEDITGLADAGTFDAMEGYTFAELEAFTFAELGSIPYTKGRYCAVRLNMESFEADKRTPFVSAVEVIARRAITGVAAGTFPVGYEVDALNVGGQTLLRALDMVCDTYGMEYRLVSGSLHLQLIPTVGAVGGVFGSDRREDFTLIEGVTCSILRLDEDDTEIVNYVIALGQGSGKNQLAMIWQDAPSQSNYGLRQAVYETESQTLVELKGLAQAYLTEFRDPRVSVEIEIVREAAAPERTDFAPGDLIRIVSQRRTLSSGVTLDRSMRIQRETREIIEGVEIIRLECQDRRVRMVEALVASVADTVRDTREAIKGQEAGSDWVGSYNDDAAHEHTVYLDFTPSGGTAEVLEVKMTSGTQYYTAHSGPVTIETPYVRVGRNKLVYAVQRTSGTGEYDARIAWQAWGKESGVNRLGKGRRR